MSNLTKGQAPKPYGLGGRFAVLPMKSTAQVYQGAMVAEINGAVCTGTTAGSGDCIGVAESDALGGSSDGSTRVQVWYDKIFRMAAGTNAPADTTPMFTPLYMETDNTVGTGAAGQRLAGYFMGFEDDGYVRVYFGRLGWLAAANGTALANTATQTVEPLGPVTRYTMATMSQGSTVTLSATGAAPGDMLTVSRTDTSANTLTVANGGTGGGNIAVLVASKEGFVKAWFDGTNWNLDSCSGT